MRQLRTCAGRQKCDIYLALWAREHPLFGRKHFASLGPLRTSIEKKSTGRLIAAGDCETNSVLSAPTAITRLSGKSATSRLAPGQLGAPKPPASARNVERSDPHRRRSKAAVSDQTRPSPQGPITAEPLTVTGRPSARNRAAGPPRPFGSHRPPGPACLEGARRSERHRRRSPQ